MASKTMGELHHEQLAQDRKDKKVPMDPLKTIVNRSTAGRKHVLQDGRVLLPGASAEVGLTEFNKLSGYRDLVDADKITPHAALRLSDALKENEALRTEVADLKAKLEAATKEPEAEKEEGAASKKKR